MTKNGPTKTEMSDALEQIAELAEEALDPENSREELVRQLKEIADLAGGEDDEEEEEPDTDEDE